MGKMSVRRKYGVFRINTWTLSPSLWVTSFWVLFAVLLVEWINSFASSRVLNNGQKRVQNTQVYWYAKQPKILFQKQYARSFLRKPNIFPKMTASILRVASIHDSHYSNSPVFRFYSSVYLHTGMDCSTKMKIQ